METYLGSGGGAALSGEGREGRMAVRSGWALP